MSNFGKLDFSEFDEANADNEDGRNNLVYWPKYITVELLDDEIMALRKEKK